MAHRSAVILLGIALATVLIVLAEPAAAQDCSVDLTASPSTIYVGQQSTLRLALTASLGYTLIQCATPGGTSCGSPSAPAWCVQPQVTTTYTSSCSWRRPSGATCQDSDSATVVVRTQPFPTISLTVDAPIIVDGTTTALRWTSTNTSGTCTAAGGTPNDGWAGQRALSGVYSVHPGSSATYWISCAGSGGGTSATTSVSVFGTPQNLGSVVNRSGDELAVSINRASSDTMIVFGYAPPGGTGDLYQAIYTPSTDRWSAPSALPTPVNSTGYEHSASNQGSQIVFTAWRSLPATNFDLWQSLWKGKAFTSPTVLTGASTTSNESYPFITADGSKLLFASDRAGGAGTYDIYQAVPTSSGWGNVTRIGSPISSSASDISPFISKDGSTLFFSSTRGGNFDIYYAKKKGSGWDTPIAFGAPFNTSSAEQSPALTDDGTRLYFVSNRNGGYGGLDLYVSVRK